MEIKNALGYVVCKVARKGRKARIICPSGDHGIAEDVIGISGFVYVYSTRKQAQRDAEALTRAWTNGTKFIVKKATVVIE